MARRRSDEESLDRAAEALRECEVALKSLAKEAIAVGRYDEVAHVTAFARSVSRIAVHAESIRRSKATSTRLEQPTPQDDSAFGREPGVEGTRPGRRFARDGDALVMIGTSKNRGSEYAVRATKVEAESIVRYLTDNGRADEPISTRTIFALGNLTEDPLPMHRGYVVLRWLIKTECIERLGNAGYVVPDAPTLLERFKAMWAALPGHDSE